MSEWQREEERRETQHMCNATHMQSGPAHMNNEAGGSVDKRGKHNCANCLTVHHVAIRPYETTHRHSAHPTVEVVSVSRLASCVVPM